MIGATVPTIGGLPNGFRYGDEWGCECLQVYVTLSRRWEVAPLQAKEVTAFRQAWRRSAVAQVVAHVPYLVNVASPDEALRAKSLERLLIEFDRCEKLSVPLLVLHPGGYRTSTREEGLARVTAALDFVYRAFPRAKTRILLETMAGQGTMLGSRFEELAQLLQTVQRPECLGVCFDTSHVFAAGYDIRGYAGYERVMSEFDRVIGLARIEAFHTNDSKGALGSKSDRHAAIGEGAIGIEAFHALVRDERFRKVPKMLELHNELEIIRENVDLLKELQRKAMPVSAGDKLRRMTG